MRASIILETNTGEFSTRGVFSDFIDLRDHMRLFIKTLKERRKHLKVKHVYYYDLDCKYKVENEGKKIRGNK